MRSTYGAFSMSVNDELIRVSYALVKKNMLGYMRAHGRFACCVRIVCFSLLYRNILFQTFIRPSGPGSTASFKARFLQKTSFFKKIPFIVKTIFENYFFTDESTYIKLLKNIFFFFFFYCGGSENSCSNSSDLLVSVIISWKRIIWKQKAKQFHILYRIVSGRNYNETFPPKNKQNGRLFNFRPFFCTFNC